MVILIAILVLGFLIFVHELGHFMVAKIVGIQVDEFSIGFGPKLLGYQKKEDTTLYSVRLLPLGGYVKMAGENPEDEESVNGFNTKPLKHRFAVISAGSIMNFLVAILLIVITYGVIGIPIASNSNVIGEVVQGSPAMAAGLEGGDRIISINDVATENWEDVTSNIRKNGGQELKLVVERNNQRHSFLIKPKYDPEYEIYQIGITQSIIWQRQGFFQAIQLGLNQSVQFARLVFESIGGLIAGKYSTNDVAGPVGITVAIGEAAKGGIGYLMIFAAVLGINLAIINLLPIPALDGSKLIFLTIEGLWGKPVDPEKENFIHLIGFALLMVFFILITYNDIARIISGG
ncbi:MAG: RIP metalloprotease RseP [Thermacetogeniaceae bacterium]|nr:RIP metalloprotease RseP [Thermoanaerobacterales bacterium]NLN20653.1 RIP metalloprotease RseP [Syntrophomonadaceae bacterium]